MKIVKMWCENTKEGIEYLQFNRYKPICRISTHLWLVSQIGNMLDDVTYL